MNYADKLGVPYVVFLGDDEIAAGLVACKDMTSGEQTKLSFEDTLSRITQGLSQRNQGKVILENKYKPKYLNEIFQFVVRQFNTERDIITKLYKYLSEQERFI